MKMFINGKRVDSSNGAVIEVIYPVTGEVVDTVPDATEEDVKSALKAAKSGKKEWSAVGFEQRYKILCQASDRLLDHKEELAELLVKETGKLYTSACREVVSAATQFRGFAEKMRHTYEEILPHDTDLIMVRKEPLGVVVCIVPFNFPIDLYAQKVAPALAMGNAVIVKPSSQTPRSGIRLSEIIVDAGVPPRALQVVTGSGSRIGRFLAASPEVNALSITGSTAAGIDVYTNGASHLARVFTELGGNDALVVLDDIDLDIAVQNAIGGRMPNNGQVCAASKRFIVQNNIKADFTERLIEGLKKLKIGDPYDPSTTVGTLIRREAGEEIEEQIQLTVAQGAKCVLGGHLLEQAFFEPTVIIDVTPEMDIAKDLEVFGPVFPIIGFDTDSEAIEIVNASKYGLSAGVISKDIKRAMRVAEQIDSGGVVIGGSGIFRDLSMPFGGHKYSGIGGEGFSITLSEMSQTKTVVIKDMFGK